MSALRLARAVTGRERILKFEGCYHGHADALLVAAGQRRRDARHPGLAGRARRQFVALTVSAPYNDLARRERRLRALRRRDRLRHRRAGGGQHGLRAAAARLPRGAARALRPHGALLDLRRGDDGLPRRPGAARRALYGVRPDLTCLGKVVGGGLPAAAYGGRADLMAQIAPDGPVYQAGTLSGNPLAMAAGLATLERLRARGVYEALEERTPRPHRGARRPRRARPGSRSPPRPSAACSASSSTPARCGTSTRRRSPTRSASGASSTPCSTGGVYLAPSAYEAGFVSLAHRPREIAATLEAARRAFRVAAAAD